MLYKKKITSFFIIFLFCFSVVFGQSDNEVMTLEQIDSLIESKDFTSALRELSLYIKVYPNQFDKAQKRISKVMQHREYYNLRAFALSDLMRQSEDVDNVDDINQNELDNKKMEIILALEKSENNFSPEHIAFTNDARRTVRLSYYINRSNAIIAQGEKFVLESNLSDYKSFLLASEKFKEGISIKTYDSDVYYEGDNEISVVYDSKTLKEVEKHINNINNYYLSLKNLYESCQLSYTEYINACTNGDVSLIEQTFKVVNENFTRLSFVRNMIQKEGKELQEIDKKILSENPGLNDTSFVTFSLWAILGVDNRFDTGLIGSMDAFWNTRVESMKNHVYLAIKNKAKSLFGMFDSSNFFVRTNYTSINSLRVELCDLTEHSKAIHNLYSLLNDCKITDFVAFNESMDFAYNLFKKDFRTLFSLSRSLMNEKNKEVNKTLSETDYVTNTLESIAFFNKTLNSTITEKNDFNLTNWKDYSELKPENIPIVKVSGTEVKNEKLSWKSEIDFYNRLISAAEKECVSSCGENWSTLAKLYSDKGDKKLSEFTMRHTSINNYLIGVKDKNQSGIIKYYPKEASDEAVKLNKELLSEKNKFIGYKETLNGGLSYKNSEKIYSSCLINIDSILVGFEDLIIKNNSVISQAKLKIQLATKDENEANLNYQRAVSALNKNNFEEARTLLDIARKKYTSSLSQQENSKLRIESDEKLFKLDLEISKQQNEYIVSETRYLKDSARTAYYEGNFEEAEKNLVQARTLWAITNVENDQEIENLMALVNNALSMKTGRVIASADPLYPEMSQILSIANQYYVQGEELMNKGQKDKAIEILNQAREKLKTLQLIYPLNQEASLLSLKIDKLIDPKTFNEMFERKIENAKNDYKNKRKQNQAYADLLDLQQINPNYKGLASLILNVEYDLGIKQKPIDNSSKIKSSDLQKQAEKLYSNYPNDESQLRRAISLLDQAISLNPDNKVAKKLKDEIQTNIGGRATDILSAADEQTYQLAVQEMNRGNIINANTLVEELVSKNGRNKKLRQLQTKIKSLM